MITYCQTLEALTIVELIHIQPILLLHPSFSGFYSGPLNIKAFAAKVTLEEVSKLLKLKKKCFKSKSVNAFLRDFILLHKIKYNKLLSGIPLALK